MSEATTIYVVMAHTGEYSDHKEWAICAFTSETQAKELVSALDGEARRLGVSGRRSDRLRYGDAARVSEAMRGKFGGDWQRPDYTGYDFDYFATELRPDTSTPEETREP